MAGSESTTASGTEGAAKPSRVKLRAADGWEVTAYQASPSREARGGLVLLHEIFGLNRHIREVSDGFAAEGYEVIAPALFDRAARDVELDYDQNGVATGRKLREQIGWDAALCDVQAAIDGLSHVGRVAVLGYCWGGTLAFLAATRLSGIACAVSYYGGQSVPFAQEHARVPVLMHFGEEDPRIPAADRETIRQGNPQIEMHLFPADHGFNCNHRKEFHETSARRARAMTLDFLSRHLQRTNLLSAGTRQTGG